MKLVAGLAVLAVLAAACTSATTGSGAGSRTPASSAVTSVPSVPTPSPTLPTSSSAPAPVSSAPPGSVASTSSGPATSRTVLRPVTAGGSAAPGWTVRTGTTSIYCSPAEPSPVAVDPAIAFCSPSAAFAIACWQADAAHALCAVDLAKRVLYRYPLTGSFASPAAPTHPAPFTMSLADGATCTIRDGGTGENLTDHPDWVQYYFCADHTAVYGPRGGTGVASGSGEWTVYVAPVGGEGDVHAVGVRTATFVGTARG